MHVDGRQHRTSGWLHTHAEAVLLSMLADLGPVQQAGVYQGDQAPPCVGAEKVLLPGLSTHWMVQCHLGFAERIFAADPSCRSFRWSQLRPEQQAPAAAAASLALWWSAQARLTPDGTVQAVWAALEGLVPSQKDLWRPPDRDILQAAQELDAGVGSATADAVQAWW